MKKHYSSVSHSLTHPSDTFSKTVYYFAQAGSNFEPVYIFEVIYGHQRDRILFSKVIYGSNIRASKSPYITFKSNIRAQKWTQIGSNIRPLKMYHWDKAGSKNKMTLVDNTSV